MIKQQILLYIYEIQYNIYVHLIQQINNTTPISFVIIFTGGLLTSLSPCMASSIPLIISYVDVREQLRITPFILLLGIATSILGLGIFAIIVENNAINQLHYLSYVLTLLLIIIGLDVLEIISINLPLLKLPWKKIKVINDLSLTYIFGISIGLNISPCSTPILTILILWITNTKNIITGISFLILYVIGYISPIILCLISMSYFNKLQIIYKLWSSLSPLTRGFLISTGIFYLCNNIISIIKL